MKRKKFLESLEHRKTFELAEPTSKQGLKFDDHTMSICQACSLPYSDDDVTIIDDVGPACLNCMSDAVAFLFNGSAD